MIPAELPVTENKRLQSLYRYAVLDTQPEKNFDDITLVAAEVCDTPIALVSLVDAQRQWFKSKIGFKAEQTSRHVSFCAHAILEPDVLIVEDMLSDIRFFDNPLVTDAPKIRFYAGAPLITSSGERIGTLCVLDTVPRKLSAQHTRCLTVLASQVMSQLELRLSVKEAQADTEAKSSFLANVSHEIRTPMNAILTCTDLLIDEVADPGHLQKLGLVRSAADGLMMLVNEILGISKMEFDPVFAEERTIFLHDVANGAVQTLRQRAAKLYKNLEFTLANDVPKAVVGDPNKIRQLLFSLIDNALKFCRSSVTVSITTADSAGERFLQIAVQDDGSGIPVDEQIKIFEQFFQASSSSSQSRSGFGLGLYICNSLCEAMCGRIWVESEPGAGATFFVQIPLNPAEITDYQGRPIAEPGLGETLQATSPARILVAEDSEVNRFIVTAMLEKLGYSADLVEDGREAVEASLTGNYDLIFMDIRMPVLDGIEATREIRRSDIRQPAIIAITANAFPEDEIEAINAGMDGFITKPIECTHLQRAITAATDSKPLNRRLFN